ncbi:MAG: hypothetical protein JST49_02930 [Bacteroidetes bacterium]|nr:hypothetical protein [Bacteroidota bacterium]
MRNILLIEPNYKNKYPPIGLMKISTYHKILGDRVTFFKGDLKDFILNRIIEHALPKLARIDKSVRWEDSKGLIKKYIRLRQSTILNEIALQSQKADKISIFLKELGISYKQGNYPSEILYDRVYVTTLFTFYWKITIDTIQAAKKLVSKKDNILIGGVMASLLSKEITAETGIVPMAGLLDKPGALDKSPIAKKIIIDDLALDYSILDEIDYEYPTKSAYFTFMTKGCTRKCAFCSVPKLEPTYKPKIETIDKFKEITARFGDQQNLLLMDNNVLASPNFPEIIQEIKDMGFYKGATYVEPNQLEISIRNLKDGYNDRAYVRKSYRLIQEVYTRSKGATRSQLEEILHEFHIMNFETTTKKGLISAFKRLAPLYEKLRYKRVRQRFVDFNQGTDARYVTDELMRLMSEIPIKPLRIAFDYLGIKNQYVRAVELAGKYGIQELSNYILYNFNDPPEDLYERLRINVELSENLNIHIYSFPMKYIPLFGEEAKGREFVGKKWNKKFIRAIQSILNVTKGIVAPGRSFFERAFGRDINEFFHLLYMPETYIVYRKVFDDLGYIAEWRAQYDSLNELERAEANELIISNNYKDIEERTTNPNIKRLLQHYTITRDHVKDVDRDHKQLKTQFDRLIKTHQHHNLTLTYDFEKANVRGKRTKVLV